MQTTLEKPQTISLQNAFETTRALTLKIVAPLATEDYVPQPIVDVSPPKWHLGHTTWFFEQLFLKQFVDGYQEFHPNFSYVFNSYYESVGDRVLRNNRGDLTRPTVAEVLEYRKYVNSQMSSFFAQNAVLTGEMEEILVLGINHEQQHQELLSTDLKYILGTNPLRPKYALESIENHLSAQPAQHEFVAIAEGVHEIGFEGEGFHFDNERSRHKVYLQGYNISKSYVTNGEWLNFIAAGGYQEFKYWLSEGWDWVKAEGVAAPFYWYLKDGEWWNFTLQGPQKVNLSEPVKHISFYEADAYANFVGKRLPTEAEWEVASCQFEHGLLWEWTNSAYLAYPGFRAPEGAIGEYNGKFMINQMVLRGGSVASPAGHVRPTYRNFWHADKQWQYTGLRLAD